MANLLAKIQETVDFIRSKTDFSPEVGIILGSGLTALADEVKVVAEFDYSDLPNFPLSTVKGHGKRLILGYIEDKPVVMQSGRFHFYEGYTMQEVTFPVRIMKALGCTDLFVSNASGSTSPDIHTGHLVLIKDHINFTGDNPLIGPNEDELGLRFPDMLHTYNLELNKKVLTFGKELGYSLHEGVYIGVKGPNLETPAEYAAFHRLGADIIGMSTVPEVIVAVHAGLKVFGISVVCDQGYPPEVVKVTTHDIVVDVASRETPKMIELVKYALRTL